ncbi:MAG: class I SAM-dependent methyltransferase [Anaerolineae bacterium]|nr:class I SAM-dependent methyltransferase [Anaerolineae bacterium]
MTDQLVPQNVYNNLPYVYDDAGFSAYALEYTPIYLNFLQKNGWIGRRILDLGCGTGISLEFFSAQRMMTTGVDVSEGMIDITRQRLEAASVDATLVCEDVRRYTPVEKSFDLVISIGDVMNYISSVRDLEAIFQKVNYALDSGRTFLFDLRTLRSLAEDFGQKTQELVNNEDLYVVVRNHYDYETQTLGQHFTFFYQDADHPHYVRAEENHVLRGYPFRAVTTMLTRSGFEVKHSLDLNLNPFDPDQNPHGRVVIVAEKVRDL